MKNITALVATIIILSVSIGFTGCDEAAQVAHDELGPRALLNKYVWLKEAHAQLDKKNSDIKVYRVRLKNIADQYVGVPRKQWAREDLNDYNQANTELTGVIASYNDLCAQYNAKMAEVQWRFTNVGQLPEGASETLPREYAPYKEN